MIMRLRVKWFNIDVIFNGNKANVHEKKHAKGKYCHRYEVEPFIRRIESEYKKHLDGMKHLKNEMIAIKSLVKNTGDRVAINNINVITNKLNQLISTTKEKYNRCIDKYDDSEINTYNNDCR